MCNARLVTHDVAVDHDSTTHDPWPWTNDHDYRPSTNVTIDSTKGITGLKGALRYVRAYRDHVFVVKLGGDVLGRPGGTGSGGGPALPAFLAQHPPRGGAWRRAPGQCDEPAAGTGTACSSPAGESPTSGALEVAKMVYAGCSTPTCLAALREHEIQAVGLSGVDADLLTAQRRPPVKVG